MYDDYVLFLKNINTDNIRNFNFKSNNRYNKILEHVSYYQGIQYLNLIENDFSQMPIENVKNYLKINDMHGQPKCEIFTSTNGTILFCSPTSLRYVYHALVILTYLKKVNLKSIVEVGCGYGGLYLAICYFSNILNIEIDNYYFIDFPEVNNLIDNYIKINEASLTKKINYCLHNCFEYGNSINDNDLFLISNYCFTEISQEHIHNYIKILFNKVKNGFILWQTCFGVDINKVELINKDIKQLIKEKPQTASEAQPNYFVYF